MVAGGGGGTTVDLDLCYRSWSAVRIALPLPRKTLRASLDCYDKLISLSFTVESQNDTCMAYVLFESQINTYLIIRMSY